MDANIGAVRVGKARAEDSLGWLMRTAHRAFVRALAAELAPYGINNAEWSALRVLWREDGMTQVELAEHLAVEKASLTPVLAGLEEKRLIERLPDPTDRRKRRIRLTPAGGDLRETLLPLGAQVNARAAGGLSRSEMEAVWTAIGHMVEKLEG